MRTRLTPAIWRPAAIFSASFAAGAGLAFAGDFLLRQLQGNATARPPMNEMGVLALFLAVLLLYPVLLFAIAAGAIYILRLDRYSEAAARRRWIGLGLLTGSSMVLFAPVSGLILLGGIWLWFYRLPPPKT